MARSRSEPSEMEGMGQPGAYTFPSVLHFLHREHNKFEREKKWWVAEKAELLTRLSFLEGQRLGEANLKRDLLRRIKMLEVSLQSERAKNSKGGAAPVPLIEEDVPPQTAASEGATNVDKEGRHVLLQYLSEMQYTDAVIEAQAQRVRGMLDSWSPTDTSGQRPPGNPNARTRRADDDDDDDEEDDANEEDEDAPDGFVEMEDGGDDDDEDVNDFLVGMPSSVVGDSDGTQLELTLPQVDPQMKQTIPVELPPSDPTVEDPLSEDDIALQQAILKNFTSSRKMSKKKNRAQAKSMFDAEPDDAKLGELLSVDASSVAAEADGASSRAAVMAATGEAPDMSVRKSWKMKMELRGHLDGVREVLFHPHEPLLVSTSEDATVAVWHAAPTPQGKLVQASEPLRIMRGHTGPVYAATFTAGGVLYTGGADTAIIAWQLPSASADKYPLASAGPRLAVTAGHAEVVWSLDAHATSDLVVSGAADGVCKLWDASVPVLREQWTAEVGSPIAAVQFLKSDVNKVLVGAQDGSVYLLDAETGQVITTFKNDDSDDGEGTGYLYDARSHPTMNVFAAAYGAKHVKVFDINAGACVDTMVAHPSAVSSIDFDPSGLYMISTGHNRSIRIWDFGTKKCVYENTTHRYKHDESIHAARFHPGAAYYASAGADAIVRVYC
eukprot:m.191034 g.191034  ORF g.191034 m.191034 type:complete len:667 (-) comp24907_c0_seq1:101-2101(-)